jgi:hypothetical protein
LRVVIEDWKRAQGFPSENNPKTNSNNLSKTGEESLDTRSECNVGKQFLKRQRRNL